MNEITDDRATELRLAASHALGRISGAIETMLRYYPRSTPERDYLISLMHDAVREGINGAWRDERTPQ